MPWTLGRVCFCLCASSLKAAVVSTAASPVPGPPTSRGLDENHDSSTPWLRRTSEVLKQGPSQNVANVAEEKAGEMATATPPTTPQCWIFAHQVKSGGTTIKRMLSRVWGKQAGVYDSNRWRWGEGVFGEKLARGESPYKVVSGGYSEALGRFPSVVSSCRFFTMFRHPVPRMVSAYFYCQEVDDQLCASEIVRARDVDLLTFAKHWSNFAVRQFALRFVPAKDVMAYAQTPQAKALFPETVDGFDKVKSWYLFKMYLERPEAAAARRGAPKQPQLTLETTMTTTAPAGDKEEEEEVPDAALYQFLEPIQALLSDGYAAVGIIEHFNTTLSLLDATIDMPGMDWRHEFKEIGGARNKFNAPPGVQQTKADLLEKAWTDPELKRYMQLDLLLYEHAVDVFHQQARSHGLHNDKMGSQS